MASPGSLNSKPVFLEKGKQAFLFLHGFTSTPSSLMPVAEALAQKQWTVSMPLLPGHGVTPEAMAASSAEQWLKAALDAYDKLAERYPHPAVAGLSMGAALALHVAAHRDVPAVVALSPALYLKDWRVVFIPLLKLVAPWRKAIGNDIKGDRFREESYERYHLKNIQDLLQVMSVVRGELKQISAPLLTMQSQIDHVVPPRCMEDLVRWAGSKVIEQHRLQNSYHVITMDNDYEFVAERMHAFLSDHLHLVDHQNQ